MNKKNDILFAVEKLKAQLVYNMSKAEGNTHTVAEVITVVDMGVTVGGKKLKEHEQVVQIAKAWDYLIELIEKDQFQCDKRTAMDLNQIVAKADYHDLGCFRNRNVGITGTEYIPPDPLTIREIWDEIEHFVENEQDKKYAAFNVFLEIARNQVFNDGNKRTGQLLMNGILMSNNLHVVTFPDRLLAEYAKKLISFYETGEKKEMSAFLEDRQMHMEKAFKKSENLEDQDNILNGHPLTILQNNEKQNIIHG
ncbi:MAG: Fic family protein [Thermodesulfobacteriota bacterium]|nr:Fic family protein [Thermodesulfobacteriota bacterium]